MKTIAITVCICLISIASIGQTSTISYAEVQGFGDISTKKNVDHTILREVAEAHLLNGSYAQATPYYERLVSEKAVFTAEDHYNYARCLKFKGKYHEAEQELVKYAEKAALDYTPQNSTSYLSDINKQSNRYSLQKMESNTAHSEIPIAVVESELYYLNNQGMGVKDLPTGSSTYNIWQATISSSGSISQEKEFSELSDRLHEGGFTISQDGNWGFFTRNEKKSGQLSIVRAERINGKWEAIAPVHFCSDEYSLMHPVLSKSGKSLYFTSDMPGGYGQTDIYIVDIMEDGSLGQPVNLGPNVNTFHREGFPFVNENGDVYFASDGHNTLGGLDVFVAQFDASAKKLRSAINLGSPVNTVYDDFAYLLKDETHGYFASNRSGGNGSDDIYRFNEHTPIRIVSEQTLSQVNILSKDEYSSKSKVQQSSYYLLPKKPSLLSDAQKGLDKVQFSKDGTFQSDSPLKSGNYLAVSSDDLNKTESESLPYTQVYLDNDGRYNSPNYLEDGDYYLIPQNGEEDKSKLLSSSTLLRPDGTYASEDPIKTGDYYLIPKESEVIAKSELIGEMVAVAENGKIQSTVSPQPGKYALMSKSEHAQLSQKNAIQQVELNKEGEYASEKVLKKGNYYLVPNHNDQVFASEEQVTVDFKDDASFRSNNEKVNGHYYLLPKFDSNKSYSSGGEVIVDKSGFVKSVTSNKSIQEGEYFLLPLEGKTVGSADVLKAQIGVNSDGTLDKNAGVEPGSYYLIDPSASASSSNLSKLTVNLSEDGTYSSKQTIENGSYYLIPVNGKQSGSRENDPLSAELMDDGTYKGPADLLAGSYYIIPKYTELIEEANLGLNMVKVNENGNYQSTKPVKSGNYIFIPREDILNTELANIQNVKEIKNIYFDLNSSVLSKASFEELDALVEIMHANPSMQVQMSGHADQRGSEEYNMWLSDRRAVAAAKYLMKNGITKDRVFWKAVGETSPTSDCPSGDCDEGQFALDRRVEFTVFE